jgi:hypothetical protein
MRDAHMIYIDPAGALLLLLHKAEVVLNGPVGPMRRCSPHELAKRPTFVKRKGLHYACTCRHIMESIQVSGYAKALPSFRAKSACGPKQRLEDVCSFAAVREADIPRTFHK